LFDLATALNSLATLPPLTALRNPKLIPRSPPMSTGRLPEEAQLCPDPPDTCWRASWHQSVQHNCPADRWRSPVVYRLFESMAVLSLIVARHVHTTAAQSYASFAVTSTCGKSHQSQSVLRCSRGLTARSYAFGGTRSW